MVGGLFACTESIPLSSREPVQMKLLLSNDDGIDAPGLGALLAAARDFGTPVIVAPATPQSGMSHAVTWDRSVRLESRGELCLSPIAASARRSVRHEEDVLALVLVGQVGMLLAQVREGLLDEVVLVLAANDLATRAGEGCLHGGPP